MFIIIPVAEATSQISAVSYRIDPPCNDSEQFLYPKRLGEKIIGSACLCDTACSGVGGEQNHGNIPGQLTPLQLLAQFSPIFALQQDIEQDQVGEVAFHALQTPAIQAGLHAVSFTGQYLLDDVQNIWVVIDHQDVFFHLLL